MKTSGWAILLPSFLLAAVLLIVHVESCNEAVCGSVVSKCLLTQSCKCDLKNCSCCKDCFNCLSFLYSECCSCVDMCPNNTQNNTGSVSTKSHVEDFIDHVPGLFSALTESADSMERWSSITYPIDIDPTLYTPKKELKIYMQTNEQEVVPMKHILTVNCTVAFIKQCMSWTKCKKSCLAMGSSSYRWFHDGCCECIGPNCINYGINESRCKECPTKDLEGDVEETPEDELDYGEDEDFGDDLED